MKIVTVTPINKGIFKESLTYFSAQDVTLGGIVVVPVKNRQIEALVIGTENLRNMKSEIKEAGFSLKKITEIKSRRLFLPDFIIACQKTADYFATTLGAVIKSATPKAILEEATDELSARIEPEPELKDEDNGLKLNKFIVQEEDADRIGYYKSLIRESLAKKQSVFMCLPTESDVVKAAAAFDKGIKDFTIVLHNHLSKKELLAAWTKAIASKHALLIIATPLFLSLPRPDVRTIIMEKENSSAYKDLTRPFIDFRLLAEFLAETRRARLIFGDLVIRSESIFKTEKGEYTTLSSLKYRSMSNAEQIIIENGLNKEDGQKGLSAISDNLQLILSEALANKKKVLIFSGRKGSAPQTVCNDCGAIAGCHRCHSPLVLHQSPGGTADAPQYFYLCHKCGQTAEVKNRCQKCSSWRLTLLGFGLEKVEEEAKGLFPNVPLFKIESDAVKSAKKAQEIADNFHDTKGPAILLGTEMVLSCLTEKIDTVAMVAIDAAFALPDFRISEKMFNLILKLRRFADHRFAIQTRNPAEKVFSYAIRGNLLDFYREEIEERMRFGYPPFKVLIKITREGPEEEVTKQAEELGEQLSDWAPIVFPAFNSRAKNHYRMHLLIKLPPEKWVDNNLLAELKALPPAWIIDVEPESIL